MVLEGFEEITLGVSLAESVRNFGYNFNTAVSDIVDNSIAAGASQIRVSVEWHKGKPEVCIWDNGGGMSEAELSRNLVLGSSNPRMSREKSDLGRFGLGLKTASLAIARQLHVFSKKKGKPLGYRAWDLDVIEEAGKWLIANQSPDWYSQLPDNLKVKTSGTLVVWRNCDRLLRLASTQKKLQEAGSDLIIHLSVYFGRFLASRPPLKITVNGTAVPAWNPIPKGSRSLKRQTIGDISVHPFVVPQRKDFINHADFDDAAGPKGWNAQQGFYVYRQNRLIVNGGWLQFKKMKLEEHAKQARIIVDIPNSVDLEWNIDVSKSKITLPAGAVRDLLESTARKTRKEAQESYRSKGKFVSRRVEPNRFLWLSDVASGGEIRFRVNREHPIIKNALESYSGAKGQLYRVFSLLEKTLPIQTIQTSANEGSIANEEIDFAEVLPIARKLFDAHREQGKTKKASMAAVLKVEPFLHFADEITNELDI